MKSTKVSNIFTNTPIILIVDDNEKVRKSLSLSLNGRQFDTKTAETIEEGWNIINEGTIDLALIDIQLGDCNGLDLLQKIHTNGLRIPVIMFTGYGTIETAIEAIKLGAFNFIQKPVKIEQLVTVINSALKITNLEDENKHLRSIVSMDKPFLIKGPAMEAICEKTIKLAKTQLPVLIQGESGTGKELVAELIHQSSDRSTAPLVKINCASLPEALLDDELFGHEKGSFTGAVNTFKGVFERADGGSLFLDELGDMTLATQAKILRAIQNKEVKRIGGNQVIKVDVRFIAATNKNLEEMIRLNTFREDLYYRLNTAVLYIPPLRERKNEILGLAKFFLDSFGTDTFPAFSLGPDVESFFLSYNWPGNIRELKSVLQYAAAITTSSQIGMQFFPSKITTSVPPREKKSLHQEMEEELILKVLKECGNNKQQAAKTLGISRATIYNKLREFGL